MGSEMCIRDSSSSQLWPVCVTTPLLLPLAQYAASPDPPRRLLIDNLLSVNIVCACPSFSPATEGVLLGSYARENLSMLNAP